MRLVPEPPSAPLRPIAILHLEDSLADSELIAATLAAQGVEAELRRVETRDEFLSALAAGGVDLVLSDHALPAFDGTDALRAVRRDWPHVPFILVSGQIGEEAAVEILRLGAADYVLKGRLARLGLAVTAALEQAGERAALRSAERALRSSEERYSAFVASSSEAIWALALEPAVGTDAAAAEQVSAISERGRVVECNPATAELRGRPPQALLGARLGALLPMPPDALTALLEAFVRSEHRLIDAEIELRDADDRRRHFLANLTGIVQDGALTHVWCAQRDLTERRRGERRLAVQYRVTRRLSEAGTLEEALPKLLRCIGEGLGFAAGELWRIDEARGTLARACGWSREGLQDSRFEHVSREQQFALGESLPGRVCRSGRPLIVPNVTADPLFLRAEAAAEAGLEGALAVPVQVEGRIIGVLAFYAAEPLGADAELDTVDALAHQLGAFLERKQLEARAVRSQRLESIGAVAGGIAHDLNNVLAPIRIAAELLRGRQLDPRGLRLLESIDASARRGAELVKQILTFARGVKLERRRLDAAALLRELEGFVEGSFPASIERRFHVGEGLPAVEGDATQLHQVLLNLCVNARDAMRDGGTLGVAAEGVRLDESSLRARLDARPGAYLRLSVADTGHGIPVEILDRIFEPFFTTKEPGMGTGLGLSTSIGIVKSHGGFVDVESRPGEGTRFLVYLPAVEETTGSQPAAERG